MSHTSSVSWNAIEVVDHLSFVTVPRIPSEASAREKMISGSVPLASRMAPATAIPLTLRDPELVKGLETEVAITVTLEPGNYTLLAKSRRLSVVSGA